ncbi:MAG: PfkB family carbohydrate kinase [Gammaproteobacteria bacterium]|nr:PfkB family carbohydrate kinase [Gammaproteobacteria bacterium]
MRVLAVGVATLDIVDLVERYPPEDAEVRALARAERRGGNAANTLAVLAQLGHEARWAGTVADDADARRLLERAAREGIDTTARVTHRDGCTPVSHVIASRATSSRTIVHYRQLPELEAADFARVPLQGVDWVHFEGRNVPALGAMLERVRDFGTRCSLEVEKPRDGIEALFPLPDVLLCARHYALARGHATAADLLAALPRRASQLLCCAWGADGAWAVGEDGALHHSPSFPPPSIADTVGAGDAFNAGFLDGVLRGFTLPAALRHACVVAGAKCGTEGFAGVGALLPGGAAVCRLEDLDDPGSRGLQVRLRDGETPCFVVRVGTVVHAYRNACPHTGAPLEWRPHQFLDGSGELVQCALHGALFARDTGQCLHGPCAGRALTPVPVDVHDGWVRVGDG